MASKEQQKEAAQAVDPPALIADDKTQTVYGVSLGELIAQQTREIESRGTALQAAQAKVIELEAKLKQAEASKADMAALIATLRPYRTLTRLENGNIRLPVELDADAAMRYLSQAEDAQEDPQDYINRQVGEALLAYAS